MAGRGSLLIGCADLCAGEEQAGRTKHALCSVSERIPEFDDGARKARSRQAHVKTCSSVVVDVAVVVTVCAQRGLSACVWKPSSRSNRREERRAQSESACSDARVRGLLQLNRHCVQRLRPLRSENYQKAHGKREVRVAGDGARAVVMGNGGCYCVVVDGRVQEGTRREAEV